MYRPCMDIQFTQNVLLVYKFSCVVHGQEKPFENAKKCRPFLRGLRLVVVFHSFLVDIAPMHKGEQDDIPEKRKAADLCRLLHVTSFTTVEYKNFG